VFALLLPEEEQNFCEAPECEETYRLVAQAGGIGYSAELFRRDFIRINTFAVEDLVNNYRIQNGLKPTTRGSGICNIAQIKADYVKNKFNATYNETTNEYDRASMWEVDLETQYSYKELMTMCPECVGLIYTNTDAMIVPKRCVDEGQSDYCDGSENPDLGIVENYPSRVFKRWKADEVSRKLLLKPAINACVASNGGVVVYAIDALE